MSERILGVLAGGDLPPAKLAAWARSATRIYAADAGALRLREAGGLPDVVIGDLDSAPSSTHAEAAYELLHDPDQDTTDLDKLLSLLIARGHSAVTLVGVEGDRLDHLLATLYSASRSSLEVSLGLRTAWGRVLKGPVAQKVPAAPDTLVSLLPLGAARGVSLTGVVWPFTDRDLTPDGFLSISNRALGPIEVTLRSGAVLLTVASEGAPDWPPDWP